MTVEDFLSYFYFDFDTIEAILLGVFAIFILVELFFYLYYYKAPLRYARKHSDDVPSTDKSTCPSVSVVIVSSDAALHLEKTLPLILEQDYPNFEVIVVNNGSTDETDVLIKSLQSNYSNLYGTYLPLSRDNIFGRKKLAMTIGVKAAKNDVILFTEAYCMPISEHWIATMMTQLTTTTSVVAGYSCFFEPPYSFASRLIAFDNLAYSLQYLSMIIHENPFSATFRNLAIRKNIFFKHKGFASVLNYEQGEELFLNQLVREENTEVCLSQDSFVKSTLDKSEKYVWQEYKIAYQHIKKYFRGTGSWIFGLESFSRYWLIILWSVLLAKSILDLQFAAITIATLLALIIIIIQLVTINKSAKLLKSGKFYFSWFLLHLLQPIRNFSFKRRKDKSRKTVGSH